MTERRFDIDFVYARLRQSGLGLFVGDTQAGLVFDEAGLEVLGGAVSAASTGDVTPWLRTRVHPADLTAIDSLLGATAAVTTRFRVLAAGDQYRWVEATATLEESGLVGTVRRVDELEATKQALEQAVAELERFAFVVSHDLKAPLRGLRLAVGWLRDELGDHVSDSARENMAFIETRSQRLTNLVNGVLEYSRLGRASPTCVPVDPHAVALETIEDIAGGPTLAVRFCGAFARVLCDPIQLKQVFQNLFDNAIKYAGARELRLKVSATASGGMLHIAVEDNGVGIPLEHRARVLQPFARLDHHDDNASTGMGLSFCQRIVENWGGRIAVEEATGGGTKVVFSVKEAT